MSNKTTDEIKNTEKEEKRIEEKYKKINKDFYNDETRRNEINYLYKKIYINYITLIENNNLDIKEEITFIKLRMNRHENEMFKYYLGLLSGIISGILVTLITLFINSDFSKKHVILANIGIIIIIFLIYIILKSSSKDIKSISNEKLYYSTCLLVLNDLEEELL